METKLDFLVKEAKNGRKELVESLQKLADSSEELKGLRVEIDIYFHNTPVRAMPKGSNLEIYPDDSKGLVTLDEYTGRNIRAFSDLV